MRPVAITGDIKQAFHQIRIWKEDRDALRFYWINDSATKVPRFTARAVIGQAPFWLSGTLDQYLSDNTKELH